jgi:hypothetical protein
MTRKSAAIPRRARHGAGTGISSKLYTLDAELGDIGAPTKSELERAMRGHVLERAEIDRNVRARREHTTTLTATSACSIGERPLDPP